jgi:hypothetical protein
MGELWMTQYDSASQEQPSRVAFLKIEFSACFIPKTNSEHSSCSFREDQPIFFLMGIYYLL